MITHALDQYLAFSLDVQARLQSHREDLISSGWSEVEAWALCQRVEERLLGPAMDLAASADRIELELRKVVESWQRSS